MDFIFGFVLGGVITIWAAWKWADNGWLPSKWYEDRVAKLNSDLAEATAALEKLYSRIH